MKALITGKSKLAGAIISRLHDTIVYKKLEIESCRVEAEIPWKHFDIFINNASVGFSQTDLLNEAFSEWRHDSNKLSTPPLNKHPTFTSATICSSIDFFSKFSKVKFMGF